MAIQFFIEDIEDIRLIKKNIKVWLKHCINKYGKKAGNINYIFCSDEYLRNINIEYLKHDYYTDIITFNYNQNSFIHSDIYISIDRVRDNAKEFNNEFDIELRRVMVHGILHLLGFNDESSIDKQQMRIMEDDCLTLFS